MSESVSQEFHQTLKLCSPGGNTADNSPEYLQQGGAPLQSIRQCTVISNSDFHSVLFCITLCLLQALHSNKIIYSNSVSMELQKYKPKIKHNLTTLMCKTQDVVNDRKYHFGHELHPMNISDHRAVVYALKRDLGQSIWPKQWFIISPFNKNLYCKILSSSIFVYIINPEKMKALYCKLESKWAK